MPPEIVGQFLWTAIDFPPTEHIEALVVEQENPARPVAVGSAECTYINRVWPAMNRMRTTVASLRRDLLGFDDAHDARIARVRFGVDDVDPRGAQARHDQVAPLDV